MAKKKENRNKALALFFAVGLITVGALGVPVASVSYGGSRRKFWPYDFEEIEESTTAENLGIDNTAPPEVIANAERLNETVLAPLVAGLGFTPAVNSWYRSPELNEAVGGSSGSDHLDGSAVDLDAGNPEENILIVREAVTQNLPFDQIIIYGGWAPSYVHIGQNANATLQGQRRQILRKVSGGGYVAVTDAQLAAYYL